MAEVRDYLFMPGDTNIVSLLDMDRESYAFTIDSDKQRAPVYIFTCTRLQDIGGDILRVKATIFCPDKGIDYEEFCLNSHLKMPFGVHFGSKYGITAIYNGNRIIFEMASAPEKKDSDGN